MLVCKNWAIVIVVMLVSENLGVRDVLAPHLVSLNFAVIPDAKVSAVAHTRVIFFGLDNRSRHLAPYSLLKPTCW